MGRPTVLRAGPASTVGEPRKWRAQMGYKLLNTLLTLVLVGSLVVVVCLFWCSFPIPLTIEAKFRLSGMVIQMYGISAVVLKLKEGRRQFVGRLHLYIGLIAFLVGTIAQGTSSEMAQYVTSRWGGVWPWCGA